MPALDLIDARPQSSLAQNPFHEWTQPNGAQWATFHRMEREYLIRFFDLADFILSKDGLDVTAYPVPGVSNQTIEHLYLNLVVPLALSRQFKLILHGSAVVLGDAAVAFLATSGRGKSTLAASFSTNGYRFLTDDSLQLNRVEDGYVVQPSHPSIRLWDDSREALIPCTTSAALPVDYTPKARLLADEHVAFCDEACPLGYVYFLGEGNTDAVSIAPVSGRDAMIELAQHSFLLDMEEKEMLTYQFEQFSALARQPVFSRLDYPRRYDILTTVRELVVKHKENRGQV